MTRHAELDERLLIAMRAARRYHLSAWVAALRLHRGHETFFWNDSPVDRTIGFVCSCTGTQQHWDAKLTDLREALPEHREWVLRIRCHERRRGSKKARREAFIANRKAKALLHRFLTKEQRWELRGSKSFRVVGQDGRTYLVTEGMAGNVRLVEGPEHVATLCVVPKYEVTTLPMYDLMLAQKILLESQTEEFLRTARVRDLRTGEFFSTGAHLLGQEPVPEPRDQRLVNDDLLDIPDQVLDNPTEWVQAVRQAHAQGDEHGNADQPGPDH